MTSLETIRLAVERTGLAFRGALALAPSERVGALAAASSLVLVGTVGARSWPVFAASPESTDSARDPLDRWSRRVIGGLADELSALALYPFDGPPYWPFQAWARRAEPVFPSPLGLLIHPEFGLWHSFRGALAFAEPIEIPPREARKSPCESCADRPCLGACPVGAFSDIGYDVEACARHLRSAEGGECVSRGCLARRASPVGRQHEQNQGQAAFHMRAFLANRR